MFSFVKESPLVERAFIVQRRGNNCWLMEMERMTSLRGSRILFGVWKGIASQDISQWIGMSIKPMCSFTWNKRAALSTTGSNRTASNINIIKETSRWRWKLRSTWSKRIWRWCLVWNLWKHQHAFFHMLNFSHNHIISLCSSLSYVKFFSRRHMLLSNRNAGMDCFTCIFFLNMGLR